MKNYKDFLKEKQKTFINSGFEINEELLNNNLFDFQKYAVTTALKKGRL